MSEEQLNNALDKMNIAEILKKNNATLNSPVTKEFDNKKQIFFLIIGKNYGRITIRWMEFQCYLNDENNYESVLKMLSEV